MSSKEYQRKRYQENKEDKRLYNKTYRQHHKSEIRERKKKYYEDHKSPQITMRKEIRLQVKQQKEHACKECGVKLVIPETWTTWLERGSWHLCRDCYKEHQRTRLQIKHPLGNSAIGRPRGPSGTGTVYLVKLTQDDIHSKLAVVRARTEAEAREAIKSKYDNWEIERMSPKRSPGGKIL
jgi:hypothetical protein